MIRRVVVFRWTAEATEEQKQQVAAVLRRLPALLPVLRAYQVGPDLGLAEGNFDFAVVADFDDLEGLQVYRDNPEHRAGPRSPATGNRPAGARRCAAARQPHRGATRPGPGEGAAVANGRAGRRGRGEAVEEEGETAPARRCPRPAAWISSIGAQPRSSGSGCFLVNEGKGPGLEVARRSGSRPAA
jgi:hypothetical protein